MRSRITGSGIPSRSTTGSSCARDSITTRTGPCGSSYVTATSLLRAKCPDCRTNTAVAIGSEYECHACGRTFKAGLVRVPRAWGDGGEEMVESAALPLDYPE